MATGGISFRGGGFPSLAVLFLSDGPWGGNGPRASGIPPSSDPHEGGRQEEKTGTGMVRYTGSLEGGGSSPHPRAPALPPRATLLLAHRPGEFVQKTFRPCHHG